MAGWVLGGGDIILVTETLVVVGWSLVLPSTTVMIELSSFG